MLRELPRLDIYHWGPNAWNFLHTVTYNYSSAPSSEDKNVMFTFLRSIPKILPCKKCGNHFETLVNAYFPNPGCDALSSREKLVEMMILLHNKVNARLSKKQLDRAEVDIIYLKGKYCRRKIFILALLCLLLLLAIRIRN